MLGRDSFKPIRIDAFPTGTWRLDWFGEVAYPYRRWRRRQPSVAVYMSPVAEDGQVDHSGQHHVWVSVGTLVLLRVGDIWCNGELKSRPDDGLEEFKDVQIDRSTTNLIKAGLNLDDKGFLIPLNEHQGHRQCTQTYCLMVKLPDERRLIIPCMELVRFYFGSSSSLLTKLFLPPIDRKSLYSKPWMDQESKTLFLTLGKDISGASAADIGRIHLDLHAWHAVALVGSSCLKDSVANRQIFPQAIFPFEGVTTLEASGQWLSYAGQDRSTFLVFNLRSCSHPLPFNAVRYKLTKEATTEFSDESSGRIRRSAGDSKDQKLVENDASGNLAPKTQSFWQDDRFTDLKGKQIRRNAKDGKTLSYQIFASRRSEKLSEPVSESAVGEPGSNRRISRPCKTPQTRMNTSFFDTLCAPIPSKNVKLRVTFWGI